LGKFFAYWATVSFEQCFENGRSSAKFGLLFLTTKCLGYNGRLFHKPIWSPCLPETIVVSDFGGNQLTFFQLILPWLSRQNYASVFSRALSIYLFNMSMYARNRQR
jgi:hypothetical protein